MAHWLEKHIGSDVEVHYINQTGYRDRGYITDAGDGWVELQKDEDDILLIPNTAIRIIKVIKRVTQPTSKLLKPAGYNNDLITGDDQDVEGNLLKK